MPTRTPPPPAYRLFFRHDGQALIDTGTSRPTTASLTNEYMVDDRVIQRAFGIDMPDDLADLIAVAMAIYTADRLCPRDPRAGNRYDQLPPRRFDLCLGLRQPDVWTSAEVAPLLQEFLWFLTEDLWSFSFFALPDIQSVLPRQGYLFPTPPAPPVRVSLFSGGLDSFAGLCHDIRRDSTATFVTVAGYTNPRLGQIQRSLLRGLKAVPGAQIIPVQIPFGLKRAGLSYEEEERSQRSRGFVYAALGAVTAAMAGAAGLSIYENGIGAINLPFTEGQLGGTNTRAAHPATAAMMRKLIRLVTGRDMTIQLPFLFMTKGKLCGAIADLGLGNRVRHTVSCDGFPQRISGRHQCGRCTSCLLRRASLLAAGLQDEDDPSGYIVDVYSPNASLSEAKAYPSKAMRDQVRRLDRALQASSPWRALMREFPSLMEVAEYVTLDGHAASVVESRLVALYRAYCQEWHAFEDLWRAPTLQHVA